MISLNLLYSNQQNFKAFLDQNAFDTTAKCFVRIYSAICTEDQAVTVAKEIKETLANAAIMGATGSGIIQNGKQYEAETLVIIELFDYTEVSISTYSFDGKTPFNIVSEIKENISGQQISIMHLICGKFFHDIHNFIEEFNVQLPHVKLTGGIAGDILSRDIAGYVFTEQGVIQKGIITASLCSTHLHTYNAVNIAHEPISPVYTINKCEDTRLIEIENNSALLWCQEQFGLEDLKEYKDWQLIAENDALIRFQFVLEEHGGASRFIRYDSANNCISLYFTKLNNNTRFRIGYTSPTRCAQECFDICIQLTKVPVESLFCYTCLFRKLYLSNCAEWELRPFLEQRISGVFMMGEIAYLNERNEFFNGSCSILSVAEQEHYITPNFAVFEDMYKITDDNQELHNFILQKQSAATSRENQILLKKLIEQQEKANRQLHIDSNTGLPNMIKYSEDQQIFHFDKICVIQVENFYLISSHFGQTHYYSLLKQAAYKIDQEMNAVQNWNKTHWYILNDNTLFLTASSNVSELHFMELVRFLYDRFHFINLGNKDDLFINRFVVVLNQDNMLEKGIATLQNSINLQTHFLVYNNQPEHNQDTKAEMEMLHILNQAIDNKWIVPYFQGIHDNEKNEINKYEALMRIYDENGIIFPPASFMNTAKKYHLYSSLSKLMIENVFSQFGNKKIDISLNLSAYDINSETMRDFIFEQLKEVGNASNFIFEILEDENFRDLELLRLFISDVRQFGVRIAIDDFGSGYSNFMEIAKIEPDYIKIDASIIKNIDTSELSQKVLKNIVFLGKQLDAELIAEFVENKRIQTHLEALGIQFSQGFYFSKPVPYSSLAIQL